MIVCFTIVIKQNNSQDNEEGQEGDTDILCDTHFLPLNSAVGIANGYGLDDQGVGVRVPVGQEFLVHHIVQTGYVVHPASY
jgi:hypothetical protein